MYRLRFRCSNIWGTEWHAEHRKASGAMQNQADQSREPLSGESVPGDQSVDLGRRIYARYGDSPGVIPMGLGPGLARQIYRFSDRVPLLDSLQRRWSMEGVSFSAPTSLLWHRALTLPRPAARSLQAKPRTAISASNGLPAGTRQLERASDDGITAQGTVTQSQTPGATSVPIVDSARSEFIDEGVTTRATGKMERTGAPSGVLRAASSPSIQVFDRRHEAGMTHDRALASSTAGIIRKSGDGAPSPHVQRRHSYEIKPARTTEEISPRLPQKI